MDVQSLFPWRGILAFFTPQRIKGPIGKLPVAGMAFTGQTSMRIWARRACFEAHPHQGLSDQEQLDGKKPYTNGAENRLRDQGAISTAADQGGRTRNQRKQVACSSDSPRLARGPFLRGCHETGPV